MHIVDSSNKMIILDSVRAVKRTKIHRSLVSRIFLTLYKQSCSLDDHSCEGMPKRVAKSYGIYYTIIDFVNGYFLSYTVKIITKHRKD